MSRTPFSPFDMDSRQLQVTLQGRSPSAAPGHPAAWFCLLGACCHPSTTTVVENNGNFNSNTHLTRMMNSGRHQRVSSALCWPSDAAAPLQPTLGLTPASCRSVGGQSSSLGQPAANTEGHVGITQDHLHGSSALPRLTSSLSEKAGKAAPPIPCHTLTGKAASKAGSTLPERPFMGQFHHLPLRTVIWDTSSTKGTAKAAQAILRFMSTFSSVTEASTL